MTGHSNANGNLLGLDLLRLLAAVMVVFYHVGFQGFWGGDKFLSTIFSSSPSISDLIGHVGYFGWIGVEIFFVISGFVIYYTSEGATAFTFFRSRFVRLMPSAWIGATIALVSAFVISHLDTSQIIRLYIKSIAIFPLGPWIISSLWTLPIELSFYAIVFVLIFCNRLSHMVLVVSILGFCSVAYWSVYGYGLLIDHDVELMFNGLSYEFTRLSLLHHGCFFAIGVLLCSAMMKHNYGRHLFLVPLFISAGILEIISTNAIKVRETGIEQPSIVPVCIWLIAVALIINSVLYNEYLHKKLGHRAANAMRVAGMLTYPLYLVHESTAFLVMYLMAAHVGPYAAWTIGVISAFWISYLITMQWEPWLKNRTRIALDLLYNAGGLSTGSPGSA
ncbi:MAG: hypothetical protein QOJ42_263 [Acidobacteriaceae bacterium]|nr:hypothetical protein [Acidobacteriaceae bacterium]